MSTEELRRRLENSDPKWQNLYAEVQRRDPKGDRFREMAVPGLEYIGVQSASWESLCLRAAGWGGADVHGYLDPLDLKAFRPQCYASTLDEASWVNGLAGLALFARLMAIVTREE